MTDTDTVTGLQDLRRKVLLKEPVTAEEYRLVLESIRRFRKASEGTKEKARATKAAKAPRGSSDLGSLLDEPIPESE